MNPMDVESRPLPTLKVNNDSNSSVAPDIESDPLFEGSTHYYLIYVKDENGNKSINLCVLGLFIVIIQSVLYGILINAGFGDDYLTNDKLPVTITRYNCAAHNYLAQNKTGVQWPIENNLQCDTDGGANDYYGSLILAMILVACFLQYDYLASISIILNEKSKWSKFAGLLVLIEAFLATFCCSLFAFQAVIDGSAYDAIMNTIGVLFVHDVDEKLFEALAVVDSKQLFKKCTCKCKSNLFEYLKRNAKLLITFIFIGCVILIGALLLPNSVFEPKFTESDHQAQQKFENQFS